MPKFYLNKDLCNNYLFWVEDCVEYLKYYNIIISIKLKY